jgi:cytochrome c2
MQRCPVYLPATLLGTIALVLIAGCGDTRLPLSPRTQAQQLAGADMERGRQLINHYGCVACHTIPGIRGSPPGVGPPLANVALRAYIGGVLPNTPDNLVRWLLDPPAIAPRTAMPNVGMNNEEAKDIAAYLLTLH